MYSPAPSSSPGTAAVVHCGPVAVPLPPVHGKTHNYAALSKSNNSFLFPTEWFTEADLTDVRVSVVVQ